ncbi:MAG: aldose epimerase family protein [Phycisphaerales bacterium]
MMRKILIVIICALITPCITSTAAGQNAKTGTKDKNRNFGDLPDGTLAKLYTLTNKNGVSVTVTNYGGIIVNLMVPDRNGKMADVVLGYDKVKDYVKDSPYFGALIGRYGNRIGKGRFVLDDVTYDLAINNGRNHLHGGLKGFDKVVWDVVKIKKPEGPSLKLHYLSKDGEEEYPGNLDVNVTYTLTDENELKIDYLATTDKATVCNLTHHSYFNLKGHGCEDILEHQIVINADNFTPVDEGLIPTGEIRSVDNTPMDFRKPTPIGARIDANDQQIKYGRGYDHNWVINKKSNKLTFAASVYEPQSGRYMEVWTTEPGIQFYSGNFLDGSNVGKSGKVYNFRNGFCLETQHYPDSPNHPEFPSVILRPGQQYKQSTIYKFSIR